MGQLIVRGLEDDIKERLRRRAKRHGRSLEAEARAILSSAVASGEGPATRLGSRISRRFAEDGLEAPVEELRGWRLRVPDFDG